MKGLFILANGFEDTEAIATIDVLKRSKLDLDLVAVGNSLTIKTQTGLTVMAEKLIADVSIKDYDFLVIPGGRAVSQVLDKSELLSEIIKQFVLDNKLVAAICAGPSQVGKLGFYKNENYTCFPTTEKSIIGGNLMQDKGVVRSNNFITGKAMGYSIDFALEIVEYLQGKPQREKVYKSVFGME